MRASTALRLAIANIHRPGALTPTIVLSLGLGLALLVTVIEIDGNLRRQFMAALPDKAPSFYFVDIQSADAERFDAFVRAARAGGHARARADAARPHRRRPTASRPRTSRPPPNAAWVLQSDRGITYAAEVPRGSRLVEGEWWGADYQGPPLVSFEKKIADGLGLKIGDPVDGQRARPQHRRRASPTCAASTGRASASISCWCSRPAPSPARRTPISPR